MKLKKELLKQIKIRLIELEEIIQEKKIKVINVEYLTLEG